MVREITLDILEDILKKDIQDVLKVIAKKTADKLYSIVENDWYRQHGEYGEYYDRTFEFLRSITVSQIKKTVNGFEIEIYFDTDKINPYPSDDPYKFNAHMSLNGDTSWGGRSISSWLVEWIEEGQNSPVNPESGIHMVAETKEWLNKEIDDIIVRSFKAKGFNISVF